MKKWCGKKALTKRIKEGFKLNNIGSVRKRFSSLRSEGGRDGGSAKGSEIDCG